MKLYQVCFLFAVHVNFSSLGGWIGGGEVLFVVEILGGFVSVKNQQLKWSNNLLSLQKGD